MEYAEDCESLVMDVSFECDQCSQHVEAIVYVPDPNFMAEKNKDSTVEVEAEIYCDRCGHEHAIIVSNTFYSATCYFQDDPGKYIDHGFPYYNRNELQELQWIIESNEHREVLYKQLDIVKELKESIQVSSILSASLNIMIYAHIVAAIEGYLSASYIHTVLNSKALFNRLCFTDPQLKDLKFDICDLLNKENLIEEHVSKYLNDVIFHRVDKIKLMFKSVLDHDFGDLGWFGKAVSIRHDCVHRAGITKERESINIKDEEIDELI
ncbi:MAG: hypothetical protein L6Q37_16290, partial [Bdellovibrionaceae bacterium]|nr:hypothetical protein [Pseudobdellovibrionaceae bacterium]